MAEEPKAIEATAAEVVEKLSVFLDGDESLVKMSDKIKALEPLVEGLKDLDLKKVVEEVDKLKAGQETIRKSIKTNRNSRGFVPGLEDADDEQFSILRALNAIGTKDFGEAGYELEVMKEAKKQASQNTVFNKRAQQIGDDVVGGYFVPDQVMSDVIQAIYTRSVMVNLDGSDGTTRVSILDGLVGANVEIPKFEGGTIAYWVGEENAIAESFADVGNITMNPKKLGVLVRLTEEMRKFGAFGFEALLRNDIVRAAAKKIDESVIYGNGSNHAPRGIMAHPEVSLFMQQDTALVRAKTTLAAVQAGTGEFADLPGAEMNFDDLDDMQLLLEEDDIIMDSSFAWISSPRFFRRLRRQKVIHFSGQTTEQAYLLGTPMITDEQLRASIGDFGTSNQIPTTNVPGESSGGQTTETDEKYTDLLGGNWADVLFGRWGGLEISDDAGRGVGFSSGVLNMKLIMYSDINIRQPRSIIVASDVKVRD